MTDVADLLRTALAAVGLFAGTNVDDLVVLTTLFLAARARGRPRVVQIWSGQALGIAAPVTVANGGDNVAVYVPAFRVLGIAGTAVTVVVFALGVVVWCLAASWLGSHRRVVGAVERWGHWLVPAVFVTIGVVVLAGAG